MEWATDSVPVQAVAAPRRPPWRRRVVAVVLGVAVAVAAVGWWGHPRLAPGSIVGLGDGMTWANDGVEDTRMLVRGRPVGTVTATFSVHNDGRLPFTVHGVDRSGWAGTWLTEQRVTFERGPSGDDSGATPVGQVTLNPGDQATILWSLDLRCQPPLSAGTVFDIDALPLRVSWWGIPTTRRLALAKPITFAGDDIPRPLPGEECADD